MIFAAIVAMCIIWGLTWVAIKIGLQDLPPFLSAGVRFALASAMLWPVVLLRRTPLPKTRPEYRKVFIPGILIYGLNYALAYWGGQYIGSGLSAVLFASFPFMVAILAHYFLENDKLTMAKLAGLAIGFSGIVIVFYGGMELGSKSYWGMLALLFSSLSAAYANILIKRDLHHVDPMAATALQMSLGTVLLLILGMLTENWSDFHLTGSAAGSILFLSIFGSSIAFTLYFWVLKKTETSKLSLITFVTPLVALVGGYFILDEPVTARLAFGTLLVAAGIAIVIYLPGWKKIKTV